MDKKEILAKVEQAVDHAWNAYQTLTEGTIDPRAEGAEGGKYAIVATLADGTTVVRGDADTPFMLASLCKIPLSAIIFSQMSACEWVKKSGRDCKCAKTPKQHKPHAGLSAHGMRMLSAIVPQGDPEGRWTVISDMLNGMLGSEAVLNDAAYKAQMERNAANNVEQAMADVDFYLYDAAPLVIEQYTKLQSMMVTTRQLAMMGATLINGGVNPATGIAAYDPALTRHIVGAMAAHGIHKMNKAWLYTVGVPAKSGFSGAILGVVPGKLAVAAYAPECTPEHVSVKGMRAVADIFTDLGLSTFGMPCGCR